MTSQPSISPTSTSKTIIPTSTDHPLPDQTTPGLSVGTGPDNPRTTPPSQLPPPTLPTYVQPKPDLNRPDSAYGGSGGTPSLSSAASDSLDPPPNLQPADNPPQSPLDNSTDYADSAYDDAASINESITDTLESTYSRYRWENGRRYHSYRDGAYWGPNDETHNDQQDIAHHAWRLALNHQLYLAPIQKPDRILDVGTGTGIWAIEMAELFPDAQVVGTDLSPIQPTWVPPNCVFEVDDVTMEWTFRKDSFDFIHSREMFGSIADWDEYFRQCFLHLKPGGYVEALERGVKPVSDDGTVGPDHFWTTWGIAYMVESL
ncbi:MAG: hypothetical protein L6R40_007980 [Gallowayella cf. fulva]|nr:MAG: hypothetical protein L6R40_007980 [Xanthomendoza cf. fulva]